MFAKLSLVAACCLLGVAFVEPHVLTPVGPAIVTAQSSQVFARNYNGFLPFPVVAPVAPVPAAVPAPAYPFPSGPAFFVPAPPTPVFYPQPVLYNPPAPLPAVPAIPAVPAPVVPAVAVAPAAPAAKLVAVAPVAKVAKLVRPAPYLTTIRYRSIVA